MKIIFRLNYVVREVEVFFSDSVMMLRRQVDIGKIEEKKFHGSDKTMQQLQKTFVIQKIINKLS